MFLLLLEKMSRGGGGAAKVVQLFRFRGPPLFRWSGSAGLAVLCEPKRAVIFVTVHQNVQKYRPQV